MTEKKEEWEIGYSRENAAEPLLEAKTVNFEQSKSLVGQRLDNRFLIEKDLTDGGADEGGIGLVYLAQDMKLMGKKTVVKILQQKLLENEDIARKFQHEKEALIRLDHPNIVRILDSGELSDGNPFMVMEYISGYSLRRKLRENKVLPLNYCAHIIESVGNALNAVHAQQILHRDIKPENIMLSPEDESFERVRLIDFGIARVENSKLAPMTEIERPIGTVLYMAPEQLAGTIEQTPAVDIYALAIVAYEMLTGTLPFKPQSIVEMYMLQQQGVQIPPSQLRTDLPKEAEQILLSGLKYQPHERPQNIRVFTRELVNALRSNPQSDNFAVSSEIAKTLPSPIEKTHPSPIDKTLPSPIGKTLSSPIQKTLPSPVVASQENAIRQNLHEASFEKLPSKTTSKSLNKLILSGVTVIGLGLLITGAIFLYQKFLVTDKPAVAVNSNTNISNESTGTARKMQYWLEVQKMRDGKKFDEPFESSGREIFENGYQFRLNFRPPDEGYFYLYNEGKDADGKVNYNILYPIPLPGKDSPKTSAEKLIQTDWNTFGGKAGTEKIWLIWTKNEQNVLKDTAEEAFNRQGKVADSNKESALESFLNENSRQNLKTEIEKDDTKKRTLLTGAGDKIVYLLELEHK